MTVGPTDRSGSDHQTVLEALSVELGQAYFRAGQFAECRDAMTRAMELSPKAYGGPNNFSLATAHFFLAMAQHGVGETDEARDWYDAGVQWMKDRGMDVTQRADLTRWRDEARAVLGV